MRFTEYNEVLIFGCLESCCPDINCQSIINIVITESFSFSVEHFFHLTVSWSKQICISYRRMYFALDNRCLVSYLQCLTLHLSRKFQHAIFRDLSKFMQKHGLPMKEAFLFHIDLQTHPRCNHWFPTFMFHFMWGISAYSCCIKAVVTEVVIFGYPVCLNLYQCIEVCVCFSCNMHVRCLTYL